MTIDEALLYLERDDASIRFFSPQDYEAFVTLKKYAKSQQQPCEDCISRAYIESIVEELENICINGDDYILSLLSNIKNAPSVTPQQTSWIPIKIRPMTEEEKEEIGHEYAFMYDCPLPEDGQEVLITDCYGNVEIDTFCRDIEGVYFENNCDDGEVIAWQPKPQSYKAESEE